MVPVLTLTGERGAGEDDREHVTLLMISMREPNHERTELGLKRLRSVDSTDSLRSPQAYVRPNSKRLRAAVGQDKGPVAVASVRSWRPQ